MPYKLTKTNGLTLTTVQDASIDTTTDLAFVGRNYAGYGKIVDQNFVYLLDHNPHFVTCIQDKYLVISKNNVSLIRHTCSNSPTFR